MNFCIVLSKQSLTVTMTIRIEVEQSSVAKSRFSGYYVWYGGLDPSVERVGRKARFISNVRETNIVSNLNKTIARNKEHIGASHTPHSHCISFVPMAKVEHELTLAFDSITVD